MTILDTIKTALGFAPHEKSPMTGAMIDAPNVPPEARNALAMLETALGHSLRVGARTATGRARARLAPGRAGRTYSNLYLADIDYSLERLEEQRAMCRSQLSANAERSGADALLQPSQSVDQEANLRAQYDAVDEKIAVIVSFGPALAQRAALHDALIEAESARVEVAAKLSQIEPSYAAAVRPLPADHMPFDGELQQRAAAVVSVVDARAALDAHESRVFLARRALDAWSEQFPAISASLRA